MTPRDKKKTIRFMQTPTENELAAAAKSLRFWLLRLISQALGRLPE